MSRLLGRSDARPAAGIPGTSAYSSEAETHRAGTETVPRSSDRVFQLSGHVIIDRLNIQ